MGKVDEQVTQKVIILYFYHQYSHNQHSYH